MPLNPFLATNHGAHFQDADVVARYHLRLPYPKESFDRLLSLMTDTPRTVLDVGTGTGEIARQLVEQVDRIDAVDRSRRCWREAGRFLEAIIHTCGGSVGVSKIFRFPLLTF